MTNVKVPREPPASTWRLPDPRTFDDRAASDDLVALGADLHPGTVLAAYRLGLFPMHVRTPVEAAASQSVSRCVVAQSAPVERIGWWSPDPRGVLPLDRLQVSRSLRQSTRKYCCTIDQAFEQVIAGCAESPRYGGWINADIRLAYLQLHQLGWAHSVEVWDRPPGDSGESVLMGGLYGVAIGGLFAGESMFYRGRDASKVALIHLVEVLAAASDAERRLLDVQWLTEHLASLGASELPRSDYLGRLDLALAVELPAAFGGVS